MTNEDTASAAPRLNVGCGSQAPPGWLNLDSSPGARLASWPTVGRLLHALLPARLLPDRGWIGRNARFMDLSRRWPFADGSVDAVYGSHVLEHLPPDVGAHVLREAHRVLRSGGHVRVIVPDLATLVDAYVRDREDRPADAAPRFLANTGFFDVRAPRGWGELLLFRIRSKNNHHVLHDEPFLRRLLEEAGFEGIGRRGCGESAIDGVDAVDLADRFEGAICLEATRP